MKSRNRAKEVAILRAAISEGANGLRGARAHKGLGTDKDPLFHLFGWVPSDN